ncbi:DUF3160 domain-containing protein [Prevotella sp. E13-27]|uniref:DUF3160 domain-containing protein n=1 Tax=Prevotella sp. E13-27 TaxID=2938122 RepID=UPI00200B155B|nr:DUF3160 domain-containing protein [Prevotella sp. E13-27]MCK8621650.1 DUF3160 domain-containing protein [Prevotella sp. E13-27]
MKKTVLLALLSLLVTSACKQTTTTEAEAIVKPAVLEVEKLKDSLDLQMDITNLSVSELRILRNAPAAKRGYPFRDSYLRSTYSQTTWYDSLVWLFDGKIEENYEKFEKKDDETWRDNYYRIGDELHLLDYTQEELDFMKRVKEREDELLKDNFNAGADKRVNVQNIINPGLLKTFDPLLQQQLARNGFAIVPTKHQQLFHVYEQNDYHQFPAFVTTDLYLQLYHLYFDAMLRNVEEHRFFPLLDKFCKLTQQVITNDQTPDDSAYDTKAAKDWLNTYFTVARALLHEKAPNGDADALTEYERVMKSENGYSKFLGYESVPFEYSLFRPRGHYTRNDTLKRYFRTMMWLQTVPFSTDVPMDMLKVTVLASKLNNNPLLKDLYRKLTEPMDFLMGQPDDVSVMQVSKLDIMETCDVDPNLLGKKIDEIAEKQTRIRPKFAHTSRNKVRLMPQRYQPDAEVLQEMVDYKSETSKRPTPTGLDVFAAMGVSKAEKILLDEQNEPQRWKGYKDALKKMKLRMDSINWNDNVCNVWLSALKLLNQQETSAPYFMLTPQWEKKSLNAALASWTELKHDAILYAKQPMGAECGGAGPPNPVVRGYVEPNVKFWQRAISLLESTETLLNTYGLTTERSKTITTRIKEMAEFLLQASEKELKGKLLSEEEYDQLKYIGASFENISLELIKNDDQQLWEWSAVQGPERSVALVADVYTANADNNPQKTILYEGVGNADEIYVIIELQGYLYLMRGGVFSYREFTRPYGEQRMNDEEWQKKLETEPRLGIPEWMKEIIVPMEEAPVDNEEVFYSSGC